MKFLSGLFGRSSREEPDLISKRKFDVEIDDENMEMLRAAAQSQAPLDSNRKSGAADPKGAGEEDTGEFEPNDVEDVNLSTVNSVLDTMGKPRAANVNIWDLDEDEESEPEVVSIPDVAAPKRASARARRNRTRLIGFDKSDGDVVDIFNETEKVAPKERVQFPVGWILVVEGPGRGHCFALTAGMAQIGRGEDQTIQLDFGDSAVSRSNHAAIVYDPQERKFILGHGGKANIVRLNGKPVISNEDLADGDKIAIGETTLQLKTLCGEDFNWSEEDDDGGEQDDVAIA